MSPSPIKLPTFSETFSEVPDGRVVLWDRFCQKKCSYEPMQRNLEKYLRKHPQCEVYRAADHGLTETLSVAVTARTPADADPARTLMPALLPAESFPPPKKKANEKKKTTKLHGAPKKTSTSSPSFPKKLTSSTDIQGPPKKKYISSAPKRTKKVHAYQDSTI